MKSRARLWGLAGLCLMIACQGACQQIDSPDGSAPQPTRTQTEIAVQAPTVEASQQPTPTRTPTPSATPVVILSPEPVEILFQATDGQELSGVYFPADANPAPVIVLMPWTEGNRDDWDEVARWLQGRGLLTREPDYNDSWKSSDWFPERSLETPLGVFVFNFRSCEEQNGCTDYLPAEWLLDARAALEAASRLEGVDPNRILTAGASIGADGAVGSCLWLNSTDAGTCLGSFALSPASLLTEDFRSSAASLVSQKRTAPVYCLYGLRDDASVETCSDFPEIRAVDYGYIENHGLELLQPGQSPDPLELFQEFIQEALGGAQ